MYTTVNIYNNKKIILLGASKNGQVVIKTYVAPCFNRWLQCIDLKKESLQLE